MPLVLLALGLVAYCVIPVRSRLDPPLKGSHRGSTRQPDRGDHLWRGLVSLRSGASRFYRQPERIGGSGARSSSARSGAAAVHAASRLLDRTGNANRGADPAAAIAAYQQALDLEPTWDTGWINLAALFQRQGNSCASARRACSERININNRNGALLIGRVWRKARTPRLTTQSWTLICAHLRRRDPGDLPLSSFWSETEPRKQALMHYAQDLPLDLRYRVLAAHDPEALAALVPADPVSADDWWVTGEYALTVKTMPLLPKPPSAKRLRAARAVTIVGDYFASRARARLTSDPQGAERDLKTAELLGTYNEYPNAIRAQLAATPEAVRRLLANAVPLRVIDSELRGRAVRRARRLVRRAAGDAPARSRTQRDAALV